MENDIYLTLRKELKPNGLYFAGYDERREEIAFRSRPKKHSAVLTRYSEKPKGYWFFGYEDNYLILSFVKKDEGEIK